MPRALGLTCNLNEEKFKRETARLFKDQESVTAAMQSYNRKRSRRGLIVGSMAIAGCLGPTMLGAEPTITAICMLGSFILWMFWETEKRLKTMQIRLATMDDMLERLGGTHKTKDENLIGELTDY